MHGVATQKDENAAVIEWAPLAYSIAAQFRFPGADPDDVRQEALIGVLRALRTHRPDGKSSLKTWVGLVVRRQLGQTLQAHLRHKHQVLTGALRSATNDEGETIDAVDLAPDQVSLEQIVDARAHLRAVTDTARTLSPLERHAIAAHIAGDPRDKSLGNAIYRARVKLKAAA